MGIQLAELSDAELDAFLEDFIQPNDASQTRETVPESKSVHQFGGINEYRSPDSTQLNPGRDSRITIHSIRATGW